MGNVAKFNQSKKNTAAEKIANCLEKINNIENKITLYTTNAGKESNKWPHEDTDGGEVHVKSEKKYEDVTENGVTTSVYIGDNYWTNFDSTKHFNERDKALSTGISVCKTDYVIKYMDCCDTLDSEWSDLKTYLTTRLGKITDCLNAIETAATTFDGLTSNISSALSQLEAAGLADNIQIVTNDDNVEIMYYQVYDENGNLIGQFSISEMVNAFYTYAGSAMSGAIATSLMYGVDIPEGYLNNVISGIGNNVYNLMGQGFMSVASLGDIKGMYEEIVGEGSFAQLITDDFKSLLSYKIGDDKTVSDLYNESLNNGTNAMLTGGAIFAAGTAAKLGDKTYSDENAEEAKARMEQYTNKPVEETENNEEEEKNEKTSGEENNNPSEITWTSANDNGGSTPGGSPGTGSDGGGSDGGGSTETPDSGTESNPEDAGQTDAAAQKISETIDNINETEPPATIDKETRTPEEIDSEARDDYFDGNEDAIREQREQQISEYNDMSQEEKVEALKELGYPEEDAIKLASSPADGQTAYVYGKYNQDLADSAKNLASTEGIDNFDTSFDDKNTIENIENKTANVDLTPTSENVQKARQELTVAKEEYDKSVTVANQAIDKAVEAKDNYNSVLKDIQSSSGKNPKNWTDEQVDKYNDAATMYNDAVKKANEAAKEVETAKNTYTREKDEYQTIYEKWREEAEKDVGITGKELDNGSVSDSNIHYDQVETVVAEGTQPVIDDTTLSIGAAGDDKPVMSGNVEATTDGIVYDE